jgi:uncharacterized protein YkuJ
MNTYNTINTDYIRVIPRDLFNESKLLKCIARLTLLVHDGNNLKAIRFEHDDNPFIIGLMDEGSLTITNINFFIHDREVIFKTTYNAKSNYPLLCEYDYSEDIVFNDDGTYSEDFIDLCNRLK